MRELTRQQEYEMELETDSTEGMGGNCSREQKDKKDMTALLYLAFFDEARAWSASAEAIALSSSLWEGDNMSVMG